MQSIYIEASQSIPFLYVEMRDATPKKKKKKKKRAKAYATTSTCKDTINRLTAGHKHVPGVLVACASLL
jgi:hypothetical protein